jgi:hypothetical protein
LLARSVSRGVESGILAVIDSLADEMFMRVFFLLCVALFPFSAQAEDAPLPFDVPSAAPVISRAPAVSKPVVHAPVAQPSVKSPRNKHSTRTAKKHKTKTTHAVTSKKAKGTHSPRVKNRSHTAKAGSKAHQGKKTVKPKATVHKKQPTAKKQATHKKH